MNTVKLDTFKNPEYNPGNVFLRAIWFFVNAVVFQSRLLPFYGLKRFLLRLFGAKIGKNVVIKPSVNIKYPWFLNIGENSWIGEGVWIDNLRQVNIGANCCISQGALLLCGNHDFTSSSFNLIAKEITLEEGVWVGAKAIVSAGVTCCSHSVLAIGSSTSADLDPYSVYRGNPAVKVKDRIIS